MLAVANLATATCCATPRGSHGPASAPLERAARSWLKAYRLRVGLVLALFAAPAGAANKVNITQLSDVTFGTIANLGVDASISQSVCLYSGTSTSGYNVTASGTGPSGAFVLNSATASLPYDVEWSSSSGQTAGTLLTANVPLTGQVSTATHHSCNNGPPTSASLIVILRSAALLSAEAGAYSGTLTLLVGPE